MTGYINSEKKPYKPLEDQVFLYADVDEEVAFDVVILLFFVDLCNPFIFILICAFNCFRTRILKLESTFT